VLQTPTTTFGGWQQLALQPAHLMAIQLTNGSMWLMWQRLLQLLLKPLLVPQLQPDIVAALSDKCKEEYNGGSSGKYFRQWATKLFQGRLKNGFQSSDPILNRRKRRILCGPSLILFSKGIFLETLEEARRGTIHKTAKHTT
jgi:hypothetical protein